MSDLQNNIKFHTLLPQLNFNANDIDIACKDKLDKFTFSNKNLFIVTERLNSQIIPPSPPLSADNSPRSINQEIIIPMMLKVQQDQLTTNTYTPPSPTLLHTLPTTTKRRSRRHVCKTCTMAFTTAGHLSRHNRIHTGEKNHTCPHDGCGQKFSRHDNCIQHYRTHLRKKSRK
ncbi:similar to Saccharomyces cerevisiae YDR043C NRG1 Transcriptional repressor that recruits the Cyc8p-Tup1p complex to promoters [Maudiozyma saulgeensis]|uniref:Similar to Saccharomyces cerevisiae YDR043C NRG1 Transcriptional repressor that recruits the Cyc8p-Tup1p complex to promoters n=1 Tax=Maudiozyma saulgeensis TaxID=1789683 RepID=A0A1X7R6H7_9SACH|nr:similar to Saccharomyces cerevisiae YDR043C NRG1 Transcriptional repressor that recruits the Cyc8p-Tup1p complex to promoters [Kazachstania saulgeensis]